MKVEAAHAGRLRQRIEVWRGVVPPRSGGRQGPRPGHGARRVLARRGDSACTDGTRPARHRLPWRETARARDVPAATGTTDGNTRPSCSPNTRSVRPRERRGGRPPPNAPTSSCEGHPLVSLVCRVRVVMTAIVAGRRSAAHSGACFRIQAMVHRMAGARPVARSPRPRPYARTGDASTLVARPALATLRG